MTPKFTERMTMRLNDGLDISDFHFAVFADGKPTGITRHQRRSGRRHLITRDIFVCGEDTFDVLMTRADRLQEWLVAHWKPGEGERSPS